MKYFLIIIFLLFSFAVVNAQTKKHQRVLVISGGGAKGAWGVGVVQKLSHDKPYYNLITGTSTGTLIAPLALLGKFDELKQAYTHISGNDVLKDPENLQALADGVFNQNFSIQTVNGIRRNFFKGYISNSDPLIGLIEKFFKIEYYDSIKYKLKNKNMYVSSLNLRNGKIYYHDLQGSKSKQDFDNWIWSSCNEPVYMSPYFEKVGDTLNQYVDGGIKDNVPLNKMLECILDTSGGNSNILRDTIDIVIHNPSDLYNTNWHMGNTLGTLFRMIDILRADVRENDLKADLATVLNKEKNKNYYLDSSIKNIYIRKIFMPRDLVKVFEFELNFDSTAMLEAYKKGYNWDTCCCAEIQFDSIDGNIIRSQNKGFKENLIAFSNLTDSANINLDTLMRHFEEADKNYSGIFNAKEIYNYLNEFSNKHFKTEQNNTSKGTKINKQKGTKEVATTKSPKILDLPSKIQIIQEILYKYSEGLSTDDISKLKDTLNKYEK